MAIESSELQGPIDRIHSTQATRKVANDGSGNRPGKQNQGQKSPAEKLPEPGPEEPNDILEVSADYLSHVSDSTIRPAARKSPPLPSEHHLDIQV